MPVKVLAHDTRLEGRTPASSSSCISFEVSDETHITDFFDRVVEIADAHGGISTLYLMCHGVHVLGADTAALQFCHEMIAYTTVHHFSRLRGKVERIVLFACHAAETSMTTHGDGDELCRHIALEAQAEVTAAREVQTYYREQHCMLFFCEETPIQFGEWEGPVVVYNSQGQIIAQFNNPSAWRSPDGVLHDPRLDPRVSTGRPVY